MVELIQLILLAIWLPSVLVYWRMVSNTRALAIKAKTLADGVNASEKAQLDHEYRMEKLKLDHEENMAKIARMGKISVRNQLIQEADSTSKLLAAVKRELDEVRHNYASYVRSSSHYGQ